MISVIIPTRDRADFLSRALHSIAEQDFPRDEFEVIVVDNGSSDNTRDVAEKLKEELPNLVYFLEREPGLHAGRHRGLKEARGDVLVYTDDDIRVTPQWLQAIAEYFADPNVAMLGGNNYPDFQGPVPDWLEKLWHRPSLGGQGIVYLSVIELPEGRHEISPYLVFGCNFSIRKQVVLDAGGFHPDSVPPDRIRFRGDGETHVSRYVLENGLRCIYDSRASVHHAVTPERMTFEYFRQRAFNQGVSDSYTSLRNPSKCRSLSNAYRSARRFAGKLGRKLIGTREKDPGLRKLESLMREGYREGFEFHQRAYRDDAEVRTWVHKPDYFQE